MKEQSALHRILLACGKGAARLFRQNTGVAWAGRGAPVVCRGRPMTVTLQDGDVVLRQAQPIRMGLCVGSSDIIGWTRRRVSDCDAGEVVAVFTAIEVKAERGRVRPEQQQFIDNVRAAGGIAGVARSEDEARALLDGGPLWPADER